MARITEFKDLLGKTLLRAQGMEKGSRRVVLYVNGSRRKFELVHEQDCCESVEIDDVCGDPEDLIGLPLLQAEEVTNKRRAGKDDDSSYTWTYYKFATNRGRVVLKWYGTSNGYYSERVTFRAIPTPIPSRAKPRKPPSGYAEFVGGAWTAPPGYLTDSGVPVSGTPLVLRVRDTQELI